MGKPDYKGFCEHIDAWRKAGGAWGLSDLRRIARRYETPIPKINWETGELEWEKELGCSP